MKQAIIRLYKPADLSGDLICWRLESDYCHATIQLGDTIYSATYPHIVALPVDDPSVAMPPREGHVVYVDLTDRQYNFALAYCKSKVGSQYDILAALGWLFRCQWMQRPLHVYCFELVYDALTAAGIFPNSKRLVTGDQLLVDLYQEHVTERAPGAAIRAASQKPAVKIDLGATE